MTKQPIKINLQADKDYFWCACGMAKEQPFCDGSHKGSGLHSLKFTAEKAGEAYICTCKKTKKPPYCDGSHKES